MNAAKCRNLFSFEFIFHFHVVLSQDADTGPIPPPRSVSNIESYFYCNCVVLFVSCECAFSLPTIIYGFRLFYWDWRPEKSAPSLAFSYELCFLSPVCRAVEITRSRLKHSAESFLCAWSLGEHYFLVDLIYRHERTGKRKAYANTRWRRDSWIKFLMKMFSAVCALNYRQRKTSWWGKSGVASRRHKKYLINLFSKEISLDEVLFQENISLFILCLRKILKLMKRRGVEFHERLHIAYGESSATIKLIQSCSWNCVETSSGKLQETSKISTYMSIAWLLMVLSLKLVNKVSVSN